MPDYPPARRLAHVDNYHGTEVADHYRWMEDLSSPELTAWLEAENRLTETWLAQLGQREYFRERVGELIDYERHGVPQVRGGVYVYTHNTGLQEQDVLFVTSDPALPGRPLLDPNPLSPDGTVALTDFRLSPDGRWIAYSLADGGSDWDSWRVRNTASGEDLADVLVDTKFTTVAWTADSSGFFYSRYPRDASGEADDRAQVSVWYHRLNSEQAADTEVYRIENHTERNPYGTVTDDGRFLVISEMLGWESNGVAYLALGQDNKPGPPVPLLQAWDALYTFIGNHEREFYFLTNKAAPNGRVIAVDVDKPEPDHWREIVPESDQAIEEVRRVGDNLIVSYIRDAHARVLRFDLDGRQIGPVELPGMGTASGFAGTSTDAETFFGYSDFTRPVAVYRLDLATGATNALRPGNQLVDPDRFVQEQVFYSSRDGTRIPMFIIRPRDSILDGTLPTVLYGYGGFRVSLLPGYSTARMAWLEAGGAIAVANLRGGGEYGTAWHDAGRVRNKQNVFDDFIAGAEWLIANDYTSPEHLGIWGGSNGGLLVAAVANQRPELFAVSVPAVGVLDMLRYQTASANARQWSTDYGLSDNPDDFRVLHSYSPYHNIRDGACYPATLVMADANDDRVAPWHSYKYAAALQRAQGCDRPVLLRVEARTGHAGMVTSRFINEYADQWAMVADRLGLEPARE